GPEFLRDCLKGLWRVCHDPPGILLLPRYPADPDPGVFAEEEEIGPFGMTRVMRSLVVIVLEVVEVNVTELVVQRVEIKPRAGPSWKDESPCLLLPGGTEDEPGEMRIAHLPDSLVGIDIHGWIVGAVEAEGVRFVGGTNQYQVLEPVRFLARHFQEPGQDLIHRAERVVPHPIVQELMGVLERVPLAHRGRQSLAQSLLGCLDLLQSGRAEDRFAAEQVDCLGVIAQLRTSGPLRHRSFSLTSRQRWQSYWP